MHLVGVNRLSFFFPLISKTNNLWINFKHFLFFLILFYVFFGFHLLLLVLVLFIYIDV